MDNEGNQSSNQPKRPDFDEHHHHISRRQYVLGSIVLLTIALIGVFLLVSKDSEDDLAENLQPTITEVEEHSHDDGHSHSHVDVTALPLGDDMYSTSPQKGYVYSCQTTFNGGGAHTQGPWIDASAGTWNLEEKISVEGDINWPQAFWDTSETADSREISSADVPVSHNTGTFPISTEDPAYQYDRNPNSIAEQSITFSVPTNPEPQATPECVGGEVGIATTGVLIFSAFDANGKDAVATEVQDKCQGHPQQSSYYHYHGYSSCFEDNSADGEHSELLGYAFDGFGIFGLKGEGGVELSSKDLDECHGHTHSIDWDGEQRDMYHYHFTQDFPYSVSCFMGESAVQAVSTQQGGVQQAPQGGPPPDGPGSPPPR